MSIYRVGQIWYVDLRKYNARNPRHSTGTADKKAAQEYHDRTVADLWRQDRLGEPPARTLFDAIAAWLAEAPRDASDRYRLRALIDRTVDRKLSAITTAALDDMIGDQTAGSYNRTANLLLAVLNLAASKGWMTSVPKIHRKPVADARTRWLTLEEWNRLRKKLPPYMERLARFALATGLRENNVLGLTWDQIDERRGVAWIHPDQAKAGKAIGVPLNTDARAVLEERRAAAQDERFGDPPRPSRYVFPNPDGGAYYKASNRAWYAALKSAKLTGTGVTWHTLRHTWASWHVMNGTRLEELQRLGGWKTPAMVMRYAHLAPEHLAKVAENVKPVSIKPRHGRKKTQTAASS